MQLVKAAAVSVGHVGVFTVVNAALPKHAFQLSPHPFCNLGIVHGIAQLGRCLVAVNLTLGAAAIRVHIPGMLYKILNRKGGHSIFHSTVQAFLALCVGLLSRPAVSGSGPLYYGFLGFCIVIPDNTAHSIRVSPQSFIDTCSGVQLCVDLGKPLHTNLIGKLL